MNIQEISVADVRQMFQNTLVRYNNEPCYIHHIGAGCEADCLFIGNNEEKVLKLYDEAFNFKPVNTGYVNIQGHAVFLSRTTRRQYKQGLNFENVNVRHNELAGGNRLREGLERLRHLQCKPLYNTIKNIYPSLAQAVEMFEDNAEEVAFDRQFSVNKHGFLFYKTACVGTVNLHSLQLNFTPENEYLRKAL